MQLYASSIRPGGEGPGAWSCCPDSFSSTSSSSSTGSSNTTRSSGSASSGHELVELSELPELFAFRRLFNRHTLFGFNGPFVQDMLIELCIRYLNSLSSMRSMSSSRSTSSGLIAQLGCDTSMWTRIIVSQDSMDVYPGKMWPFEIVLMLHRRRLALNKLIVLRTTIKKLVPPPLAAKIVEFLRRPPIHLTSDYLTRVHVPPGEVFVTLRRWFWMYGRLPVPRCLRRLVSVDRAHLREVKEEPTEPGRLHAAALAEPVRQRRRRA